VIDLISLNENPLSEWWGENPEGCKLAGALPNFSGTSQILSARSPSSLTDNTNPRALPSRQRYLPPRHRTPVPPKRGGGGAAAPLALRTGGGGSACRGSRL